MHVFLYLCVYRCFHVYMHLRMHICICIFCECVLRHVWMICTYVCKLFELCTLRVLCMMFTHRFWG
jgi:hypothetical protein